MKQEINYFQINATITFQNSINQSKKRKSIRPMLKKKRKTLLFRQKKEEKKHLENERTSLAIRPVPFKLPLQVTRQSVSLQAKQSSAQ